MTTEFERLFVIAVGIVFTIYLVRCLLGAALFAIGQLPHRSAAFARNLSIAVTPRLARRIAVALFGVLGLSGIATPSYASEVPDLNRGAPTAQPSGVVDNQSGVSTMAPMPRSTTAITVRTGDTLWALAQDQLEDAGHQVTDRRIDRLWRVWFQLNRQTIGDDPDVIQPGMRLEQPPLMQATTGAPAASAKVGSQ